MKRFHILISGEVQGVSFRYNSRKKAHSLNLRGWVRNLENGDVEIDVEGNDKEVLEFLQWCERGSHGAEVERIKAVEKNPELKHGTFEIVY